MHEAEHCVGIAVGFEEESEREHLGRRCAGAPPEKRKCHEVLAGISSVELCKGILHMYISGTSK